MLTLSKGFLKPQNGVDSGAVFFSAMETNIQKLNDHTHDPVAANNSQQLAVNSQVIASGAWGAAPIGGGLYVQTVTMTSPFQYDTTDMWFRLATGDIIFPTIERASATTYKIYVNDNTLNLTAFYR